MFGVFRPLVYMLYISSVSPALSGEKAMAENTSFLGQTPTSGTIVTFYMYICDFLTRSRTWRSSSTGFSPCLLPAEKYFPSLIFPSSWWMMRMPWNLLRFGRSSSKTYGSACAGRMGTEGVSPCGPQRDRSLCLVGSTGSGKDKHPGAGSAGIMSFRSDDPH